MKMMRTVVFSFGVILLSTPLIHGQDLSRYRNFTLGASLANISKQIDEKPADATVVHEHPALIEELTWWPPQPYGPSRPAEPVGQVRFSFSNGALYRMLVTYDSSATKGLTAEDMIRVVSTKYGAATRPNSVVDFPTDPSYHATEKVEIGRAHV